jgi:hypothetical protein
MAWNALPCAQSTAATWHPAHTHSLTPAACPPARVRPTPLQVCVNTAASGGLELPAAGGAGSGNVTAGTPSAKGKGAWDGQACTSRSPQQPPACTRRAAGQLWLAVVS